MVVAVRCPAEKCRKYQMVEDSDRGKTVNCLVCGALIRVPAADSPSTSNPSANPKPPPRV